MSTTKHFNNVMLAIAYAYQNPKEYASAEFSTFEVIVTQSRNTYYFDYKRKEDTDSRPFITLLIDDGVYIDIISQDLSTSSFDFNRLIEHATVATMDFHFFKNKPVHSCYNKQISLDEVITESLSVVDTLPNVISYAYCDKQEYKIKRTCHTVTIYAGDAAVVSFVYGVNDSFKIMSSNCAPAVLYAAFNVFHRLVSSAWDTAS